MKILVEYRSSSRILQSDEGTDICSLIEMTYQIPPNSYLLKRYDRDFEAYVDIDNVHDITDKDRIKIEILNVSEAAVSESFLSENTEIVSKETAEIVLNLKDKHWPIKILLPYEDFSKPLKKALDEQKDLKWDMSKELIGHLANYCFQYSKYPSKIQRQQICLSLVERYPHLKSNIGLE